MSGSLQRALSPGASLGSTILDLSAHGTPQGLVLEDGKGSAHLLSLELLQEMLALRNNSQSPCKLVVVNACHSRAVGQLLADSGMPHIVCCNDRVLDMWVELFMRTFYTTLFGGCTVASAFSTAALQLQCQPGIPREAGSAPKSCSCCPTMFDKFFLQWHRGTQTLFEFSNQQRPDAGSSVLLLTA